MDRVDPEDILSRLPNWKETAQSISRGIHSVVLDGGYFTRRLADTLHGTWLGHPLHAVLTDFVLGAWIAGGIFDAIGAKSRSRSAEQAGDRLAELGAMGALPTALAGLTDFTTIPERAVSTGATHGLINLTGFALYLLSVKNRRSGQRERGLFYSAAALGMLTVSAWLGGELVYKYKVGVNKIPESSGEGQWISAIPEGELEEKAPRRVDVEGQPVLLYRIDGKVYAIGAVCGHDGGPLDQGKFDGFCVECPWHQSVYDLRDGSIVHGPATFPEPSFETRVRAGVVEVRPSK